MAEPAPARAAGRQAARPALLFACSVALALGLRGFLWGLPSAERSRLLYGAAAKPEAAPKVTEDELDRVWQDYPNFLPGGPQRTGRFRRSEFNAIRTLHPDEYVMLKGLAQMRPSRLQFFHGFFAWPAMQFYVVGAGLELGSLLGMVTLVRDTSYYFGAPVDMARLYAVGRLVTLLMGLLAVAATWGAARRLFGPATATAAAILLAVDPLFTMNAHYLTADVPMLCWIAVALWASARVLNGGGRRWYVAAGVAAGLAAATRYQGALASLLVFAAHVFRDESTEEPGGAPAGVSTLVRIFFDSRIWLAGMLALFTFLVTNIYILWTPDVFWKEFSQEWRSAGATTGGDLLRMVQFLHYGLGPLLTVAAGAGLAFSLARRTRADWMILWGFAPALVFLWMARPVNVRYMMPVLLLPVLLAARVIGAWAAPANRQGSVLRRVTGTALGVIVVAASFAQSLACAEMLARSDPRMRAGEWIQSHVPDGATVAVLAEGRLRTDIEGENATAPADPWIFQLPPMNERRLRLVAVPMSAKRLAGVSPDYVVCSDFQFPPLANREPLSPGEQQFVDELQNTDVYEPFSFTNEPQLLGFNFALRQAPHDIRYADPGVRIYRRIAQKAP